MAGNNAIHVLRGDRQTILNKNAEGVELENGQLLYNTTDNYLTVGRGKNNLTLPPIVTREIKGHIRENSSNGISVDDNDYYSISYTSGSGLKFNNDVILDGTEYKTPTVSGIQSFAWGEGGSVEGAQSASFGKNNIIKSNKSIALGEGLNIYVDKDSAVAVGKYNAPLSNDEGVYTSFVVGDGSSDSNVHNALTVTRDSNTNTSKLTVNGDLNVTTGNVLFEQNLNVNGGSTLIDSSTVKIGTFDENTSVDSSQINIYGDTNITSKNCGVKIKSGLKNEDDGTSSYLGQINLDGEGKNIDLISEDNININTTNINIKDGNKEGVLNLTSSNVKVNDSKINISVEDDLIIQTTGNSIKSSQNSMQLLNHAGSEICLSPEGAKIISSGAHSNPYSLDVQNTAGHPVAALRVMNNTNEKSVQLGNVHTSNNVLNKAYLISDQDAIEISLGEENPYHDIYSTNGISIEKYTNGDTKKVILQVNSEEDYVSVVQANNINADKFQTNKDGVYTTIGVNSECGIYSEGNITGSSLNIEKGKLRVGDLANEVWDDYFVIKKTKSPGEDKSTLKIQIGNDNSKIPVNNNVSSLLYRDANGYIVSSNYMTNKISNIEDRLNSLGFKEGYIFGNVDADSYSYKRVGYIAQLGKVVYGYINLEWMTQITDGDTHLHFDKDSSEGSGNLILLASDGNGNASLGTRLTTISGKNKIPVANTPVKGSNNYGDYNFAYSYTNNDDLNGVYTFNVNGPSSDIDFNLCFQYQQGYSGGNQQGYIPCKLKLTKNARNGKLIIRQSTVFDSSSTQWSKNAFSDSSGNGGSIKVNNKIYFNYKID